MLRRRTGSKIVTTWRVPSLSAVKKLEAEIGRVIKHPDFGERMATLRINPVGSTSEEFSKTLAADLVRWSALAKAANIKTID